MESVSNYLPCISMLIVVVVLRVVVARACARTYRASDRGHFHAAIHNLDRLLILFLLAKRKGAAEKPECFLWLWSLLCCTGGKSPAAPIRK